MKACASMRSPPRAGARRRRDSQWRNHRGRRHRQRGRLVGQRVARARGRQHSFFSPCAGKSCASARRPAASCRRCFRHAASWFRAATDGLLGPARFSKRPGSTKRSLSVMTHILRAATELVPSLSELPFARRGPGCGPRLAICCRYRSVALGTECFYAWVTLQRHPAVIADRRGHRGPGKGAISEDRSRTDISRAFSQWVVKALIKLKSV